MCFEGKWLQNRLPADKNESRSVLRVDIQGHQRGGFCIVPTGVLKRGNVKMDKALSSKITLKALHRLESPKVYIGEHDGTAKKRLSTKRYFHRIFFIGIRAILQECQNSLN